MAAGEEKIEGGMWRKSWYGGAGEENQAISEMAKWRLKALGGGICQRKHQRKLAAHGEKLASVMRRGCVNRHRKRWQPKMAYRRVAAAALARQSAASKKENGNYRENTGESSAETSTAPAATAARIGKHSAGNRRRQKSGVTRASRQRESGKQLR
jgi:hypothetical protein